MSVPSCIEFIPAKYREIAARLGTTGFDNTPWYTAEELAVLGARSVDDKADASAVARVTEEMGTANRSLLMGLRADKLRMCRDANYVMRGRRARIADGLVLCARRSKAYKQLADDRKNDASIIAK